MKSKTLSVLIGMSLSASIASAGLTKAEKNLVETMKKSLNSAHRMESFNNLGNVEKVKKVEFGEKSSLNSTSKNKKVVKSDNSNYARIMVRLNPGVDPQKAYKSIVTTKGVNDGDINLVKSFGLAGGKKNIGIFKKQKKSVLVLESKKISTKKLIDIARKIDGVDLVEESKKLHINAASTPPQMIPNDEFFTDMWGMNNDGDNNGVGGTVDADIDAPEAWVKHKGYSSVVVGDIDTGIDYYHPDLKANVWVNKAEVNGQAGVDDDGNGYVDDYYGIDTYNGDSDPYDDHGHGTHTAGTIGAAGNNGMGVVGVNWRVKIASCKFLSAGGSGYTDGAVECVNYFNALKDAGVNIVATNNSWGGGGYSDILHDAISDANDRNINFVAAAGNAGNDNDSSPSYPASYDLPNIISVAASDYNDELTSWSNYGATSVDLAAPGLDIKSTYPSIQVCTPNNDHVYFSDDFEHGDGKWDMLAVDPGLPLKDYPEDHWQIDDSMAVSGSHSLSDSLDGNYTNNRMQTALMKNSIDLSNVNTNQAICATVKIKGTTEEGVDGFHILATADNGDTWYYLGGTKVNYDDWSDISVAIPKNLYVNNLKIALVKFNDYSITYEGYNIDDAKITTGTINAIPRYATWSGTSMATPHVTGAIAYLSKPNDNQTAVERKNRVLNAVDVIPALDGKVATGGRLNLNKIANDMNLTKGDFNNDKIADILWRKDDGRTVLWRMKNDGNHTSKTLGTVSPDHWTLVKVGDFNGDGISDIVWRKDTGKVVVWYLNSTGSHVSSDIGNLSSHWNIAKVGDFNGDGISDIIWRKDTGLTVLWYMKDNGNHTSKTLGTLSSHWSVDGVDDFNGDGISDIIWRKDTGLTVLWYMKDDGNHVSKTLGTVSSEHWTLVKVGDFTGDGISDILWRKDDGKLVGWKMKKDGKDGSKTLGNLSMHWKINRVGDFNGDGISDIIWRKDTGLTVLWYIKDDGNHVSKTLGTLSSHWELVEFN